MKRFVLSPSARVVVDTPDPAVHGVAARALVAHLIGYGVSRVSEREVVTRTAPSYHHPVPRERWWAYAYRLALPMGTARAAGRLDDVVARHHQIVGCLLRANDPEIADDDPLVEHTCVWALDVVHALWPWVEPLAERLVALFRPAEGPDAVRVVRGGDVLWPAHVLSTLWPTDGSEPWPCAPRER